MKSFTYVITDKIGIHARPAGLLVKEAKKYDSKITVRMDGNVAEATKLMALMKLGVKCGDVIEVIVEGNDEEVAWKEMTTFFEENL